MSFEVITNNHLLDENDNSILVVNREVSSVSNKSNSSRQKEALKELRNRLVEMPLCLEKVLLVLIYRLSLKSVLSEGIKIDN